MNDDPINAELASRMVQTIGKFRLANLVFAFGLTDNSRPVSKDYPNWYRVNVLRRIVEANRGFLTFLNEGNAEAIALVLPKHMGPSWELLNVFALIELCEIGKAIPDPFYLKDVFLDLSPRSAIEAGRESYVEIGELHQRAYLLAPINGRIEALSLVVGMIPQEFDLPAGRLVRAA